MPRKGYWYSMKFLTLKKKSNSRKFLSETPSTLNNVIPDIWGSLVHLLHPSSIFQWRVTRPLLKKEKQTLVWFQHTRLYLYPDTFQLSDSLPCFVNAWVWSVRIEWDSRTAKKAILPSRAIQSTHTISLEYPYHQKLRENHIIAEYDATEEPNWVLR